MRSLLGRTACAAWLLAIALPAGASCLGSGHSDIEALAKDIGRQPYDAVQAIERALVLERGSTLERRTWLEAARANAKRMLGLERTELQPALQQAAALPGVHPAVLQLQILALYGKDLSASTLAEIDRLRRLLGTRPPNEPATLCLKIRLASAMAEFSKLNGDSFEVAADAYRHAESAPLAWMRAEAASVMGQVALRTTTAYAQTLSTEALRYFEAEAMHDMVANELFMDALAWSRQQDVKSLQQAESQFLRSQSAAERAKNPFAVAYAKSGLCEVQGLLGRWQTALQHCAASLEQLRGAGNFTEYSTLINYAAALLAADRPRQSLEVLAPMTRDWSGWDTGYLAYRYYDVRGRTHAALGQPRQAVADLNTALQGLREFMNYSRDRGDRLVQARFRVGELQQSLERQTRDAKEREQRNRLLIGAGVIVLLLLSVIVLTLIRHRRLYRRMAFTDPPTGAANRRFSEVRAEEMLQHAQARREPLSVALVDLDHFKSCNDRFGHEAGDEALRCFVETARRVLRPGDLLGRWGGEEFLLALPGSSRSAAEAIIDRLRNAAENQQLELAPAYPLRFSAGAVEAGPEPQTFHALLARADEALYRAKATGRNQTVFDGG